MFKTESGELKFKDQTGDAGDQIDFLQQHLGCSDPDAIKAFLEMAGVSDQASAPVKRRHTYTPPPESDPEPAPDTPLAPFDWEACKAALTPEKAEGIAKWRGYSPEFVTWLGSADHLGVYQGCPATPVIKEGVVVGCQYRTKEGPKYANNTPGAKTPAEALVIGDPTADFMLVMESPWDAFAIMEKFGFHCGYKKEMLCFAITRSASNHKKLAPLLEARAKSTAINDVILVGQNDPPRKDGKPTGHDTLENGVRDLCAKLGLTVKVTFPPKEANDQKIKDVNDWVRFDKDVDIPQFLQDAKASTKSKITIRSVRELLDFKHSDADNYFGDRVIAESQAVTFIGPPGVGKSRIILQLAACMILGIKFIDIETHAPYKSWLFLQTENSNRRLQEDLKGIAHGLQLTDENLRDLNECLHFHTLETDEDSFLSLDDDTSLKAIQQAITDLNPDFVVFDPLNTFTTGNLNDDVDMRAVCHRRLHRR